MQLTCGMIGLGRIASSLEDDPLREKPASHAGAVTKARGITLLCGADPNPQKRKAFQDRWNVPKTYASLSEMLQRHALDLVIIATPAPKHLSCLKSLTKPSHKTPRFVICEKPLVHATWAITPFMEYLRHTKIPVLVNHERRYARDYRHVKSLIDRKTYGKPLYVHADIGMGQVTSKRSLKHMLWEDATHLIDILHYLLGASFKVVWMTFLKNPSVQLHALCRFENIPVILFCGGHRTNVQFQLDISFERGKVLIGNGVYKEFVSKPSPYYAGMQSLLPVQKRFHQTAYFSNMLAEAIAFLQGRTRQITSSALDACQTLRSLEILFKYF